MNIKRVEAPSLHWLTRHHVAAIGSGGTIPSPPLAAPIGQLWLLRWWKPPSALIVNFASNRRALAQLQPNRAGATTVEGVDFPLAEGLLIL